MHRPVRDYGWISANALLTGYIVLAVGAFASLKLSYWAVDRLAPEAIAGFLLLAVCLALAGCRLSYAGTAPAYSILLRGVTLILAFYSAFSAIDIRDLQAEGSQLDFYALTLGPYVALVSGIIAWFRPSFAILTSAYVLVSKDLIERVLGLPTLTRTDYLPLVELAFYLPLGLLLAHWSSCVVGRWRADIRALSFALFLTALAVHFGNYFWSAIVKVYIDGGPMAWLLENRTQLLIPISYHAGLLPIGQFPRLTRSIYEAFDHTFIVLNAAILFGQLASIIGIIRLRWALWLTLFYDLTHVGIFVLSGIFFWKWVLLNIVIVVALAKSAREPMPRFHQLIGVTFVAAGCLVFYAARLGWYDTPALNDHYFIAETSDGTRARVPSNYFYAASVTFAQHRLGSLSTGFYPTGTWGSTRNYAIKRAAENDCAFEVESTPVYGGDTATIGSIVRRHHAYVLRNVNSRGRLWYDFYPHHIFSNPFMHEEFFRLDKRKISRYIYVVEALCIDQEDPLRARSDARREFAIEL